jgi:tetratricopeptide (TPR) repeat protein
MYLRRRRFEKAAQSALDALQRIYQYPLAHFFLGLALAGLKQYDRAAEALRSAILWNPNFPEAHMRLAALLEKHLGDEAGAAEHRRLARRMRAHRRTAKPQRSSAAERVEAIANKDPEPQSDTLQSEMPPVEESLVVVSGLPRSGTSMLMQMLSAAEYPILSDGLREADEDNPRGYLEYEPVKNLLKDNRWLLEGCGKAIKIVAPLLSALPPRLPCRIILSERDLDEVLNSQDRMLERRGKPVATPERRRLLRDEYARTLDRVKAWLSRRPYTRLLVVEHSRAMADPLAVATQVAEFLGSPKVADMAAAIDPSLHRNRAQK